MKHQLMRVLLLGFGCTILASADQVQFSLSTSGDFSSGTPSNLGFSGNTGITGTTDNAGFLALSNLGTFTLSKPDRAADNYDGSTFTLNLFFVAPAGIDGQTVFNAALTGTVNTQLGSVLIDFGPAQTFHFNDGIQSGGFDLTINDLSLTIPHSNTLTVSQILQGSINNAYDPPVGTDPVPEPVSIVMLGSATLLIAAKYRKQIRKN